jgi:kinesin family protein 18/19
LKKYETVLIREKKFAFDRVFDGNGTQQEIFGSTTETLIKDVLEGYNGTVFAYGPTGAGKTYSEY